MIRLSQTYNDGFRTGLSNNRFTGNQRITGSTKDKAPQWISFAMTVALTFLVCTAINLRSFSELREETGSNQTLDAEVNRLTEENLALQEQIHDLKNDPATIEREARKLGMGRIGERVLVSMN